MNPYYQDEFATIWLGDCREILPTLLPGFVIVTDQPYGTGWVRGGGRKAGEFKPEGIRLEWDTWCLEWVDLCTGATRIAAFTPASKEEELAKKLGHSSRLVYRKTNVRPGGIGFEPARVSPPLNQDYEMYAYNGDSPYHPCQKPVGVMRWIVGKASESRNIIVDPFMGSGTTLLAAKDLGQKSIGIEINEKYCEIAAKRLAQDVFVFEEENWK